MRHLSFIAILLISSWCNFAWSQTEALQINGPKEVSPGQLIRLDAQLQPEESPFWIVLSPTDLDYEQVDEGRRLIFAVDCEQTKPITILLLAQQVRNERIVTRQVRRTLSVRKSQPGQSSDPNLDEDFKESPLFDLVTKAWESIDSQVAKDKTASIADNFKMVAGRCEDGSLRETPQIWKTLSESNQNVLAEQTESWAPVGLAMQSGFANLQLKTIPEHPFHLRAIAAALRSKDQ